MGLEKLYRINNLINTIIYGKTMRKKSLKRQKHLVSEGEKVAMRHICSCSHIVLTLRGKYDTIFLFLFPPTLVFLNFLRPQAF